MKVLILNGSPRAKSNSVALAEAFAEGARSAGHDVETVNVAKLKVTGCLACEYCHTVGGGEHRHKDFLRRQPADCGESCGDEGLRRIPVRKTARKGPGIHLTVLPAKSRGGFCV